MTPQTGSYIPTDLQVEMQETVRSWIRRYSDKSPTAARR